MDRVEDIMTVNVGSATGDSSLVEIGRLMVECNCGEIPIINNEKEKKLLGVITDRDIVCRTLAKGKSPLDFFAKDVMSSPVITASINTTINECVQLMEKNMIRRVPIVDGKGVLLGIVSQADIANKYVPEKTAELIQKVSRSTPSPSEIVH